MEKSKKILTNVKQIAIIVLSVFATFAMNMNMDKNTAIRYSFTGNSVFWIIFFVLTYWLLQKITKITNKRLKVCSILLAFLLATFEVVGSTIDNYLDLSGIIESQITIIKSAIKWLGYAILFYGVIANIFKNLEEKEFLKGTTKWFTDNKRTFLWVWGLIFIAWIPYFLNYYPGVVTVDSMSQICQSLGIHGISNHHPILHTFFISITDDRKPVYHFCLFRGILHDA